MTEHSKLREHFAALGRKGGPARAQKLGKKARQEIARLGGLAAQRNLRKRLKDDDTKDSQ